MIYILFYSNKELIFLIYFVFISIEVPKISKYIDILKVSNRGHLILHIIVFYYNLYYCYLMNINRFYRTENRILMNVSNYLKFFFILSNNSKFSNFFIYSINIKTFII